MRTDYQNLNTFELSAVVFIVVGVVLVATIIFSGLSIRQQDDLLQALNIFDAHQQAALSIDMMHSALGLQKEFYNQFYIAFVKAVGLPQEPIKVAYLKFLNFSDDIAFDYSWHNTPKHQIAYGAKVSGAMIDLAISLENRPRTKDPQESLDPPGVNIPYSFAPLEWQPIKNELIKIWSQ